MFLVYSMNSICADSPYHYIPHIQQSGKCVTSLAAVGAPQGVSLERLILQGAVRVTWSPPTDLCGLTNPQYTIQYGRTTSTPTTHPSMPSSSPFDITGVEVGQEYFVRVAVGASGTFSDWKSVTTCKGVRVIPCTAYAILNSKHTNVIYFCVFRTVPLFPCCSGCPTHGLIGITAHSRSSHGHLVSSN